MSVDKGVEIISRKRESMIILNTISSENEAKELPKVTL